MVLVALGLDLVFVVAAFGLRTARQWRTTGDTGWRVGRPHSRSELVARAALAASAILLGVAVVVQSRRPDPAGVVAVVAIAGVGVAVAAVALTIIAQLHMGASWRIGVDPSERTELVRTGLYRHIRNPIYTGMVAFAIGQAMMLPNPCGLLAVVAMVVGVEVQVRAVEEGYLYALHGQPYIEWTAEVGRFVPSIGRL